jgi:cell division protein ZapB
MITNVSDEKFELELDQLESRIEHLIVLCKRLADENALLRTRIDSFDTERTRLIEKNETARTKVEGMIERLKSIE